MKARILLASALMAVSSLAFAQSDNYMVIKLNDGTTANYKVTDVQEVTWENLTAVKPSVAPATLALSGSATDGTAFKQVEDGVFVVYTQLEDGELSFTDGTHNYFIKDGELYMGEGTSEVTSSESVGTCITVNFKNCTVQTNEIQAMSVLYAATYAPVMDLTYNGNGKFSGSANVTFLHPGQPGTPDWCTWNEERYYIYVKYADHEAKWGAKNVFDNRPDDPEKTPANFGEYAEYPWADQWGNCWKFPSYADGNNIILTMDTVNGVMSTSADD